MIYLSDKLTTEKNKYSNAVHKLLEALEKSNIAFIVELSLLSMNVIFFV